MNFFGQVKTNQKGFAEIQDRNLYIDNRRNNARMLVEGLREFVKFPLPRNVTFFNTGKLIAQRFLAKLDKISENEQLALVINEGVNVGYTIEQIFQAVTRRINKLYNATQLKQITDAALARINFITKEINFIGHWELGGSLDDDWIITDMNNYSLVNIYFAGLTQVRNSRGQFTGATISYQNLGMFLLWATFQETARRYNIAKQAELAAELAEQQAQMVTTQPINRQPLVANTKVSGLGYFGFGLGNVFDASKDDYGDAADIDIAALTDESKDDEPLFTSEIVKGGGATNPFIKLPYDKGFESDVIRYKDDEPLFSSGLVKGGGYTDPLVRPNPYEGGFESDVIRYKDDEMKEKFVLQDYAPKENDIILKEFVDSVVVKPTEVIRKDDGSVVTTKEVLVQDGLTLPNGGAVTPDVKLTVSNVVTDKGESIKVVATSEGELPTKTVITEEGEKKYLVDSAGVPTAEVRTSATTGSPIVATNPSTGEKTVVVSADVPKEVKTAATQQIANTPKSAATNTTPASTNSKKVADTESNKGLVAMFVAFGLAVGISYLAK
jgi:hypothetical protein